MAKTGVLLLIMLILLAVSVPATTNWFAWGNIGFQGAGVGVDDILWGSNYPQGNINMSNVTLGVTSEFPPIVADWNLDGENEIFIFAGSSIAVYNNELELLSTVNIGAPIQGQACIFNFESDADLELAIISDSTLNIYEPSGIDFSLVKTIALDTIYTDVFCSVSFSGNQFVYALTGGDFIEIEPNTETTNKINNQINNYGICGEFGETLVSSSSSGFQNRGMYVDFDSDGNNEFVYIQADTTADDIILNAYDPITETFDLANITAINTASGDCERQHLGIGNIGLPSGSKEMVVMMQRSGNPISLYDLNVLDILGTIQFTQNVDGGSLKGNYMSFPAIADVDSDSLNEMCYIIKNNFTCFTSNFIREYEFNFKASNESVGEYGFFSLGEFKSGSNFLEIIHPTGMFEINQGLSRLDGIMNFTDQLQDNLTMPMPVSVEQQASFTKDVILADSSVVRVFTRKTAAAICGNSICESGESILNCEVDCSEDLTVLTVKITQVIFEPSIANVWKNNTDVRISVTVEDSLLNNVQARTQLYFGQGFEIDSNFTQLSPSGTVFVFNTKANHTTSSSTLRITARNDVTPNLEDINLFGFTVGLDGDEFGDSSSTFNDPFPTDVPETETDTSENSIVDAFRTLEETGATGGLGFDLIWYIIMFAVGFAIFVGISQATGNGTMALGGALIAEIFLLVMGTLLGFVPAFIVITLVILGIIVSAMFLRAMFTGTSNN